MNGDLKIFSKEHAELVKVAGLHESVAALLYFKSDHLDKQVVVSGSEAPGPALVFGTMSHEDRKHLDVIARGKQDFCQTGISYLAQNPMTLEHIVSASQQGGDIHLWKLDPESWQAEEVVNNKRQKTGVKTAVPAA